MNEYIVSQTTLEPTSQINIHGSHQAIPLYTVSRRTLMPTADYIDRCLLEGETCIIVATLHHVRQLNDALRSCKDVSRKAGWTGQYVTLFTDDLLAGSATDKKRIDQHCPRKEVEVVSVLAAGSGRAVRIFGERWVANCLAHSA